MLKVAIIIGFFVVIVIVAWVILREPDRRASREPTWTPAGLRPAPPPSASRMHWLAGIQGSVTGKSYQVGARTVTIGRGVSNFVQITDDKSSRVHCQLSASPSGLELRDMDSANGTFVNDQRVERMVLSDGDEIRIGGTILRYSRTGDFQTDHGLARKTVGEVADQKTIFQGGVSVSELANQALVDCNGNVKAAAEAMGITPEVFLKLID